MVDAVTPRGPLEYLSMIDQSLQILTSQKIYLHYIHCETEGVSFFDRTVLRNAHADTGVAGLLAHQNTRYFHGARMVLHVR